MGSLAAVCCISLIHVPLVQCRFTMNVCGISRGRKVFSILHWGGWALGRTWGWQEPGTYTCGTVHRKDTVSGLSGWESLLWRSPSLEPRLMGLLQLHKPKVLRPQGGGQIMLPTPLSTPIHTERTNSERSKRKVRKQLSLQQHRKE